MIRLILAALVVSSAATLAMAQDQAVANCAEPANDVEATECAAEDLDKADKELNGVYKAVMALQVRTDKEAAAESPELVGRADALKKAQRSWIAYRDGHCEVVGLQYAGGTIQNSMVLGCEAELTRSRTAELKTLLEGN